MSRNSNGCLGIEFSTPGPVRIGTDPEQLFAAGFFGLFRKRNCAFGPENEDRFARVVMRGTPKPRFS
jgi:hypothetical protein